MLASDILLEYYVEDEATMDYIVDRLKEKYESEEEGYKHVEVSENVRYRLLTFSELMGG